MANDPFSFLDPQTGTPLNPADGQAEELFLQGKLGIKKDTPVPLFDSEDGKVVEMPVDSTREAIESGRWRFLTEEERAIDELKLKIKNENIVQSVLGGAKRAITNFGDEFLMGIPETAADAYQGYRKYDPKTKQLTDFGKRSIEAEERPISNFLGGLSGFGAGIVYGAPLLKGVSLAGEAAARGATGVIEKVTANRLANEAAKGVAKLTTEGAIMGAPIAGAKHGAAVLGDNESVGQALVAGAQDLATFGLLNLGVGAGIKGMSEGLGLMGAAIKAVSNPEFAETLRRQADVAGLKQFSFNTSQFRAARKKNGGFADAPIDPEDGVSALGKILDEQGEKHFTKKLLEGVSRYVKVDPKVPRFKQAEQALEQLGEANTRVTNARKEMIDTLEAQGGSQFISKEALTQPLKQYRTELLKQGEPIAIQNGLKDVDAGIDAIEAYFKAKSGVSGGVSKEASLLVDDAGRPLREAVIEANPVERIGFKEADEIRAAIGDMAYTRVAVPGGETRMAKSEAAQESFKLVRQALLDAVKNGEKQGTFKKGLSEAYSRNGREISDIMMYKDLMASANDVVTANAVISPSDLAIGAITGAGLGALPGLLIGAGTSFIKRQYGNAISQKALNGMANAIDKLEAKVNTAIDATLGLVDKSKLPAGLGSVSLFDKYFGDKKDKETQFKKFTSDLSAAQSNPEALASFMANALGSIAETDPMVASQMQTTLANGAGYLLGVAPKPATPQSILNPTPFTPTDSQLSKFKRQVDAVFNPDSVLNDMAKGVATPEQFDALKVVYPKLYKAIQNRAIDRMVNNRAVPNYKARQKLSYLLNEPMGLNSGKANVQLLQNNFMSKEKAKPRANSKITEASRGRTDIDRVIYDN